MSRLVLLGLVVWCVLSAASATAQDTPHAAGPQQRPAPPTATIAQDDVRLQLGFGMYQGQRMSGGLALETDALFRFAFVEVGTLVRFGTTVLGYSVVSLAQVAGVCWQSSIGLRFDLLGELGIDYYRGVGSGFLNDNPGVSGRLMYHGARVGIAYRIALRHRTHVLVGLWGFYAHDDPGPYDSEVRGDSRTGVLLSGSADFDL